MTAPPESPGSPLGTEAPVWSGTPSQWVNAGTWFLCLLAAGSFIAGAGIWAEPRVALAALVPAGIAAWAWLRIRTSVIDVTTQRISMRVGVLSRRRWDMELYRVKDTTLSEPLLLRLVGLANIEIVSSDRTTPLMMIPAIRNAESLRQQIRRNVEQMRMLRGVRELDFEQ